VASVALAFGASLLLAYGAYRSEKNAKKSQRDGKQQSSSSASKKKKVQKEKEVKTVKLSAKTSDGALTKETLLSLVKGMVTSTRHIMIQLTTLEQNARARNPGISDDQIASLLRQHYASAMEGAKEKLFAEFEATEALFRDAMVLHSEDPAVQEALYQLQELEDGLSGGLREDPEEIKRLMDSLPADLTMEKVIDIFSSLMNRTANAMEQALAEVKAMSPPAREPEKLIKLKYMAKVEDSRKAMLDEHGIDDQMFELAVRKYSDNPEFGRTLMQLQQQQQQKMAMVAAGRDAL